MKTFDFWQAEKLKGVREWKAQYWQLCLATQENFQNKTPTLHWQRDYISEAPCRPESFETEQSGRIKKIIDKIYGTPSHSVHMGMGHQRQMLRGRGFDRAI
jgi:hypothetical protein